MTIEDHQQTSGGFLAAPSMSYRLLTVPTVRREIVYLYRAHFVWALAVNGTILKQTRVSEIYINGWFSAANVERQDHNTAWHLA